MNTKFFPVIDLAATGNNIRRLRIERGLTVRDIQSYFGFEEPRAVYKWQNGESLPTVDNLYALGNLLGVPMDQILVPAKNIKSYSGLKVISTRRFCALPAAVLLLATGLSGPAPLVRIRLAATPCTISALPTLSARCCERVMLCALAPELSV